MHDVADRVRELLAEAQRMPLSAAQLAVLEEAVRIADAHQEIALGIEARRPLMWVARNLLRGDILAVAFAWCLAHHDRDPERFAGRDLFQEYRMVIGQMANLPDVSRAKLEELIDDLGRRLQAAGLSPCAVYDTQLTIAPDLGDRTLALAAREALRRHGGSQDRVHAIETELFLGNEEAALRLAGPVLMPGASRDRGGAESSYAGLLLPLLKRKCFPAARRLERYIWRSYHPERCYYWPYGDLLVWLTLTNQLGRAIRVYEECQRAIHAYTDPLTRLHFALDALVLFERLKADGRQTLAVRLPEIVPLAPGEGGYPVEELRGWVHQEARELAGRFGRRNGNDWFGQQIEERTGLQRWAISELPAEG
jgi:hypothetical protein